MFFMFLKSLMRARTHANIKNSIFCLFLLKHLPVFIELEFFQTPLFLFIQNLSFSHVWPNL
jgi:hypothetical protein